MSYPDRTVRTTHKSGSNRKLSFICVLLGALALLVMPVNAWEPWELGSIGGGIFLDENSNAFWDTGEPGIPGVTVQLFESECDWDRYTHGDLLTTVVTDENGFFDFTELAPVCYVIDVDVTTLPDCLKKTTCNVPFYAYLDPGEDYNDLLVGYTPDSGCVPPPPPDGVGTPGFWKNPDRWPVDEIAVGGVTYSKDEAIEIIEEPVKNDKTYTMFPALVAAKLNVIVGNEDSCIADTIAAADEWMAANGPAGSGVRASSEEWQVTGEQLYLKLDLYNNGGLCAPPRE